MGLGQQTGGSMRKVTGIGLVLILALSAVITGTIFAQDGGTTQNQKTWLGVRLAETEDGVVVRAGVARFPR